MDFTLANCKARNGDWEQMRDGDVKGELAWVPSMHIGSEEWRWGCLLLWTGSTVCVTRYLVKVTKECQQQVIIIKVRRK